MHTNFGRREALSASYVRYLVKNVTETGIRIDKPKLEMLKTVSTPENIAAVAESVCEEPSTSINQSHENVHDLIPFFGRDESVKLL